MFIVYCRHGRKVFYTLDDATKFCQRYFKRYHIILSITEEK